MRIDWLLLKQTGPARGLSWSNEAFLTDASHLPPSFSPFLLPHLLPPSPLPMVCAQLFFSPVRGGHTSQSSFSYSPDPSSREGPWLRPLSLASSDQNKAAAVYFNGLLWGFDGFLSCYAIWHAEQADGTVPEAPIWSWLDEKNKKNTSIVSTTRISTRLWGQYQEMLQFTSLVATVRWRRRRRHIHLKKNNKKKLAFLPVTKAGQPDGHLQPLHHRHIVEQQDCSNISIG